MRAKGVLSLTMTVVLCLPSLAGGLALLAALLLRRHLGEWGQRYAASVALGVFVGGPLVAVATIIGVLVAFRDSVSLRIKSAHLIIVGLSAIATIFLLLRFSR
jgi:hypothetical protein